MRRPDAAGPPMLRSAGGPPAALGVGLTWSAALLPLLERAPDLVDLLEFEPQTTWVQAEDGSFRPGEAVLRLLEEHPARKLVHSVGAPVGGSVPPDPRQLPLLRDAVLRLGAAWCSEHLSFNHTGAHPTGFFLPPRQTEAGAQAAAASVADIAAAVGVPVAVESGASYLRPRRDEMPDGDFAARVAALSGCGILLDLHNAYANARNGRQPLDAFLDALPLERVWEVHLAGGMEAEGFWLDAHSGAIPDALMETARQVIPRLPHLGAIVFEIFPSFVPLVGDGLIRDQVARLRELWSLRRPTPGPIRMAVRHEGLALHDPDPLPPALWERTLGALAIGRAPADHALGEVLAAEPGVALVRGLIHEFRGSMLVELLPLTTRLLMLALGTQAARLVFRDYWSRIPPRMYAAREAEAFCDYLDGLALGIPHLAAVLRFERAVLTTLVDGRARVVPFAFEPLPLLRALAEGRLPTEPPQPGRFEIEVTPDEAMGRLADRRVEAS